MSREFYPDIVFTDPIDPEEFGDVDDAVEAIDAACDGWGTDEAALTEALATKSPEERTKIYYRYELLKERNLSDRIDSECGDRNYGQAMEMLSLPPDLSEAKMIHIACSNLGTNEMALFPIILGRSNREIDQLKKAYFKRYDEDLGVKLNSELSGDFEKLIFHALQGIEEEYDPDYHTDEKADADAEAFHDAGEGQWFGTDEGGIFSLLCNSPPEHLIKMEEKYNEKYGKSMFRALDKEFTGIMDEATFYLLGIKTNPADHAATLIKKACAGWGTNEFLLTTCLLRFQKILPEVAEAHENLFGKSLYERVDSETDGDYGQMLCKLVESST